MMALCIGSAACMQEDLDRALVQPPYIVVAVNQAGVVYPGFVDHWVSMHPDLLPKWIKRREEAGHCPAGALWTTERRALPPALIGQINTAKNHGGSSGMLAVTVALDMGCDRVVMCGIPLDHEQGHFNDDKKWRDATNYRKAWVDRVDEFAGRVRSMSGWTQKILGTPTLEWLAEAPARDHSPAP